MVPANLGRDQMSQLGFLILNAHRPPMQAVRHVDGRATVKCAVTVIPPVTALVAVQQRRGLALSESATGQTI
jgi:hypothetical protein